MCRTEEQRIVEYREYVELHKEQLSALSKTSSNAKDMPVDDSKEMFAEFERLHADDRLFRRFQETLNNDPQQVMRCAAGICALTEENL